MPTRDDSGVNCYGMNLKQAQFVETGCMCGPTSIRGIASGCHRLARVAYSHRGALFALLVVTVVVVSFIASPLHAQEPPQPSSAQRNAVRDMQKSGNVSDAAAYQEYYRYQAYQIAAVGQTIAGKLKTLDNAEKGARQFQSGLRPVKNAGPAARTALQGYVLDWMPEMARGSYSDIDEVTSHGCAMAMMLIAELNEIDAPEKPLAAALPVLLDAVDGADFNNDGPRAAALYGIVRHAGAGVNDAQADAVFEKLVKIATQLQPPQGRDENIHEFFRARAIDAVGVLGATEKAPSISELARVLSEALSAQGSRGVELRCAAAAAIGQQNWVDKADVDLKNIGLQLGNLAIAVTSAASSPEELKSRLHCVDLALTGGDKNEGRGIVAGAEGESKEYIDGLIKQFNTLYNAAFAPQAPGSEIQQAKAEAAKLTDWLIKNPIAEAPAEPAPATPAPTEEPPTEEAPAEEAPAEEPATEDAAS